MKHVFRMPPEWHEHEATWLAWPHNIETWPENLPEAQSEFIALAVLIARDEPVNILVPNQQHEDLFLAQWELFTTDSRFPLRTVQLPTNDAWIRDYGPTFVINENGLGAVDWRYNAWGGKYPPFDSDQQVVRRLLQQEFMAAPIQYLPSRLCFEGGAVDINSEGVLLTTRSCALDQARNPDWDLDRIQNELEKQLGAVQVIWLPGDGIDGDDTRGHVDQLARFISDRQIIYADGGDGSGQQSRELRKNLTELRASIDSRQLDIELFAVQLPKPINQFGRRIPASYCNFYFTNNSVIVPQFGDQYADEKAIELFENLVSDRRVVACESIHLAVGLGSFHCLTQQQPKLNL